MYLLDTCAIADFTKRDLYTLKRMKLIQPSELYIASITLAEIEFGLANNPRNAIKTMPVIMRLLEATEMIDFGYREAIVAGHIRYDLKISGLMIGKYDILIAATALVHDLILVTSNVDEFSRIKGLKYENWRVPEEMVV